MQDRQTKGVILGCDSCSKILLCYYHNVVGTTQTDFRAGTQDNLSSHVNVLNFGLSFALMSTVKRRGSGERLGRRLLTDLGK